MDSFIFGYLNSWQEWIYLAIVVAMLIDGNIAVLVVGFLSSAGVVNPLYGLVAIFTGGFIEQLIWYWVGVKFRNSNSKIAEWLKRITNHFDAHFQKRPKLALFISKFIYGLHRGSLARVAVIGLSLKQFLKISVPVLFAWGFILFAIGYSASKPIFYLLDDYVHVLALSLLGLLIVIVLLERFVLSGKLKKFWQKL